MEYKQIIYEPGVVARVIMNRPEYFNAQSRIMLEEMDDAFARSVDDDNVRAIIMSGNGKHFCSGHDLGTPENLADRQARLAARPTTRIETGTYSRKYFVDLTLRWRNLPKPTIAMVHGYCIWAGWIIASSMDIIFASDDAVFLPANLQYFTIPWDLGTRKAKEILFENRFITAHEAYENHFVNRVLPHDRLEAETLAYAQRVADNHPYYSRTSKFFVNQAQDLMGFSNAVNYAWESRQLGAGGARQRPVRKKQRQVDPVAIALRHSNLAEAERPGD